MSEVLHIFKTEPDKMNNPTASYGVSRDRVSIEAQQAVGNHPPNRGLTRQLADSRPGEKYEIHLYQEPDYDRLVEEIFRADDVVCWW